MFTYALTLVDASGSTSAGTFTFIKIGEATGDPAQLATASGDTTTVSVLAVTAEITGTVFGKHSLQGIMYVSELGPPIATILSGAGIAVQLNLIDSPGDFIGGSVYQDSAPYGLLGQR
ncbi:MAG: hypothetical protein ACPGNT_10865 [Rhodospirillales bacterium]